MKGILFDMDGTLLDSMPVWKNLAVDFLRSRKVDIPDGFEGKIKTMTLREAITYMQNTFFQDEDPAQLLKEGYELLAYHYTHTIELRPHVRETLEFLKEERVPMAISTATDDHLAELALNHQKIMGYFSFLQTVKNTGHTKNEKEFWLEGARRIGMDPSELVVFEDALYAMVTAKEAGMTVIAIEDQTAYMDRDKIREICDYYLESYQDFRLDMLQ